MERYVVLTGTDGKERRFDLGLGAVYYFKWINGKEYGAVQWFRTDHQTGEKKKPSHMTLEQFELVKKLFEENKGNR